MDPHLQLKSEDLIEFDLIVFSSLVVCSFNLEAIVFLPISLRAIIDPYSHRFVEFHPVDVLVAEKLDGYEHTSGLLAPQVYESI